LPASPPRYARTSEESGHSIAYEFRCDGKSLVVAPDVAQITPDLHDAMTTADAVLFDGTFWSDTELQQIDPKARTASEMGHLPVQASLAVLAALRAPLKMYLHINNTNPILDPVSTERRAVEEAGVRVGQDGFEFEP
jgi:pyrroloquinoline quinone biosynthesis protein B